jgi:choline-glycine betaine transporter
MKKESVENKYKNFKIWGIVSTIAGILLMGIGSFMYILGVPQTGVNLATLQPVIIDGVKPFILGLVFLIIGVYRLINKRKAFYETRFLNNEIELNEYKQHLEELGYSQMKIKKLLKLFVRKYH